MRLEIGQGADDFDPFTDLASEYKIPQVVSPLILSTATPPPVVDKPLRSITPNNRSLAILQSVPLVSPQRHMPLARGAVSSGSIASTDLQSFVEPLPLDQLICHTSHSVQSWPAGTNY